MKRALTAFVLGTLMLFGNGGVGCVELQRTRSPGSKMRKKSRVNLTPQVISPNLAEVIKSGSRVS